MNPPKSTLSPRRPARRLRYVIEQALPVVGMVIVFGGAMLITDILRRVIVVAVGLLFVEVAVWNVASRILPDSRQFVPLRNEIDRFIQLARSLNAAAVTLEEKIPSLGGGSSTPFGTTWWQRCTAWLVWLGRPTVKLTISRP